MSPDKSLLVACGGEVVVAATRNAETAIDVTTMDDVLFAVGAMAAIVV